MEPDLVERRLQALLQAQRSSYRHDGPPSAAVRGDRLDRLILLLTENADEFSAALTADFGNRPHVVNLLSDIAGILPDISLARRKLKTWMRTERVTSGMTLSGLPTVVEKIPRGVVGVIGPWNFPVGLVVEPAAAAFAAGNRVMVKFSEVTPRTGDVFARKAAEYFDPTELAVVLGGADVGAAFSALPFDHLFFTGSPQVGALVARAAAQNLVPVTLELGGKNPAVVAHGADAANMGSRVMAARLANGGQICLCPDYVFVPTGGVAQFIEAAMVFARQAMSVDAASGLVSIVDDKNYDRVCDLIADARDKGATVHQDPSPARRSARRIPPTILTGVTDDMRIAHEEVFGPVLAVNSYTSISEVVEYVTARPTPLAAYWYGEKGGDFTEFRRRVASGGMTVNDFAAHCAIMEAPFGGLGRSGSGSYHGKAGFDTFTHHRTITTSRLPMSFAKLITPPYSKTMATSINAYVGMERFRARRRRAASKGGTAGH